MYQKSFSDQLPQNIGANVIFFLINILIGLFLVPYFIDNLGVASYGLIPLATSITSYVGLVTQSINSSISRYLTVDLQRQDFKRANITFNTSLFGIFGIILLLIPIIFILSYYAPVFFEIPSNQIHDAYLLFLGVMGAFLIKALSGVFGISLFAYNRLDIQKYISVVNILIQVGLIILLFSVFSAKLSYIGLSYFLGALVGFALTLYFSKKINPHFRVNYIDFKLSFLKEIVGMGNWIIINQIGALLFLQMDLIVVNKLFGSIAGGEYAAILMWSTLLRSIAGMLSGLLTPIILTYYANNQFGDIIIISKRAIKFMAITMALPIGIICGFAPQILSLWIGPEFVKLSPLMWVLLSHLIINLSVLPLFSINISFNKVRIPGLVTLFMGVGNFLLAITLSHIPGWGYYGVAVAGAIMLTLKNTLFIPWYAAKVLDVPKNLFANSMIYGIFSIILVVSLTAIINFYFNISTLITLVISCILISLIYSSMIWSIGLTRSECDMIKSFLPFSKEEGEV
ncbi:oligosaccharide flippase family protein [Methanococcoides seepicolus]|uniref:Oligosaccharide flippase family protein n=2 Tax=Methanococcoides seepicolus TaxID=2828780 RepID=A0A9E4ZGF2_9EURY|nr:oligosaccharide flippase family protein [Methanococcoides seepicolus]